MSIQFRTDDEIARQGFRAYINEMPIDPTCADWLDTIALILTTPNYPTINCNWIITTTTGNTMSIKIHEFEVKHILISLSKIFQ